MNETPFRHWIIDHWCVPCGPLPPGLPWEAEYDNDLERGKRTLRDWLALPDDYAQVFEELNDPATFRHWRTETGISLAYDPTQYGGGLHVLEAGGYLQVHLDYARHPVLLNQERRLSLIAFLHPEWKPEWGGQLLLCDPSGRCVVAIDPTPGRLVVFEGGDASYHGVRQTARDTPPRVSAAVYYVGPARPTTTRTRALFLPNRSAPGCPAEVQLLV